MTRSLNEGEMQLKMASLASISIIAVGDLSLSFSNNSVLVLHDCLFVPDSRNNLISVSKLCNDSYSISFNKTYVSIMKENEVVTCGTLVNNLYHIDCVDVEKSLKRKEPSINQTQLWVMALKAWSHKFEKNTKTSELWAISHFDPGATTTMSKLYSR